MTPEQRDRALLMYIRDSIDLIRAYTRGGSARPLPRTAERDAVVHRMETVGDAAGHLSAPPLRERHPDIPWETITGFRNRLAHGHGLPELSEIVDQELAWLRHPDT